jgi:hypothetical protein
MCAEAGSTRRLLAPSYLPAADTCFGDRSAGCCGSQRCEEVVEGSGSGFEVNVKKTEKILSGETYTTFDWTVCFYGSMLRRRIHIIVLCTLSSPPLHLRVSCEIKRVIGPNSWPSPAW